MPLNPTNALLVTSLSPSQFEDQVTFTVTVTDPISGDPHPPTAPIGMVDFVADGTFGFGSANLTPLTASITAIVSSTSIATYTAPNSFSPGQIVTIQFMANAQFNGVGLIIATASATQFTITGSYTLTSATLDDGTATCTNASQCSAMTTALIAGIHTIVATYLGDSTPITGHIGGPSNTVTQQVTNVAATNVVELPGFGLIASYSTTGDTSLPPQATLYAVPETAIPHQSVTLLWDTLNVFFVEITGDNGVDYQAPPPPGSGSGFDTGLLSTSGSGLYVVSNGFTASITLTLQAYDATQTPIGGLTSTVTITIT